MLCVLVLTSYAAITVAKVITQKRSTGKCEDGGNYVNRFIDEGNCAHVMVTGGTIANDNFKNGFFRNCVITNGTYTANNGNFVNDSFSKGGYNFNGIQGTVDKLPVIMGGTFRDGTFAPNITFANAMLENAELKYSGCIGVTFKNGTCEETSFTGQVVENGTFVNCKFNKLQFNEGNCSGTVFEGATINGGKFTGAIVVNTTIRGGHFIRGMFKNCTFEQGSFDGEEFDTEKPAGENVLCKMFSSKEVDRKQHSKIRHLAHSQTVGVVTNVAYSAADTTESPADTAQSGTNDEGTGEVTATGGGDQATGHTDPITTAPITTASTANASTASNYSKSATTVGGQPPEATIKALKEAVTSGEVSVNRSGVENTRTASPNISHVPEMFKDGVAVNVSTPTRSWRKRKKPIRLSTIEWLAITLPPLVIVIVLLCVSYRYIYKTGAEELPAEDLPVDMARASPV